MQIQTKSGPVEVALLRRRDKVIVLLSDGTPIEDGTLMASVAIGEVTKEVIQPLIAADARVVFFHRYGRSGDNWSHVMPVKADGRVVSLRWETLQRGDERYEVAVRAAIEIAARRNMGRVLGPLLAGNDGSHGLDEPPWTTG